MSMFQTLFQSIPSISLDSATQPVPDSAESESQPTALQSAGTSLANLFISLSTTNGNANGKANGKVPTESRKASTSPTPKVTDRRARLARERSPSLLDNAALFLQSLSIHGATRKPKSPPSRRLANGVKRRQSTAGDHAKMQSVNMIQLDTFLDHNHDACACLKSGSQTFVLKSLSIPENSLPEKLIDVPFHIFAHPPHRCLARHDKIAAENGLRNGCKTGRRPNGALRNGHKLVGTNGRTDVDHTWTHDKSLASKSARVEHECCDPVPDCAAAYYVFTNGVNSGRRDDEAAYSTRALVHKTSAGERWILKDSQSVHLKTWVDRYDPEASHNAAVKSDVILLPNRDEESAGGTLDVTTVHALMTCLENLVDSSGASGAKLDREWTKLQQYEEVAGLTEEIRIARLEENEHKNFEEKFVPYDHSRVVLGYRSATNTSDYINASYITDYDPTKPHYIAAQAPLCSTLIDFWQMIWENECTSIVNLCTPTELVASACEPNEVGAQSDANNNNDEERRALVRYWPKCGAELYDTIEVHLVAEHLVQEHHMVIRSFYVVHTGTKRSRTITQFNYLSWPQDAMPASIPTLLDLRRRLHRSDHSGAPILVHCSDGAGRTGAFILVDLFLASVASESMREFNLIAAIEHLRDQRTGMVSTRMQFDTAICAIVASIQESLKAR